MTGRRRGVRGTIVGWQKVRNSAIHRRQVDWISSSVEGRSKVSTRLRHFFWGENLQPAKERWRRRISTIAA